MWRRLRRWLTTPPDPSDLLRPSRWWLLIVPGAYVITVIVSVLYGTPEKLPGVALGLPLLLDLERSAAVLATIALVLIFAFLTSRGHLPTQFGNFAYPSIERQHDLEERVAALDRRLKQRLIPLEDGKRTSDEVLPLILKDLSEMSDRLEAVEARRGV